MRIQQQTGLNQDASGALEIFVAKSGVLSARIQCPEGVHHLHSAVKPEDESIWYRGTDFWGDLIVFLGTGLGHHVAPLLKAIPQSAKILLVDSYPRCIDHCMTKVFSGLRNAVVAITAQDPDRQDRAAQACRGARYIQVIKHPASYQANRQFYDAVLNALNFKRTSEKEPGGALLFYGNFFLEEELRRALMRNSPQISLFKYNEIASGGSNHYESMLSKRLQKERPAFILSVNMKGFDNQGIVGDTASRLGIPVVTWFVDDPHPILLQQRPFIRNNMVAFTWERSYLPMLSNCGFGSAGYLPLAADVSLGESAGEKNTLAEVGFVGSSMGRAFLDNLATQFLWQKELEPLVAVAAKSLLAKRDGSIWQIVQEACRETGIALPFSDDKNITWLCSYIIHTASMMLRREMVAECLPQGIRTFGDPEGWRGLLGDTLVTRPNIDYRSQIAAIYRAITISINITSCQMPTAVNQRVFDVSLCNGFIINDHQADLDELFAQDEIAVYKSKEELVSKIIYYRNHESEHRAITQKARARILAEHTYDHRIAAIRKILP